jgi:hypothetical protein
MIAILADFNEGKVKPIGKQTSLIKSFFQAAEDLNINIGVFHPEELVNSKTPQGYFWGTDIQNLNGDIQNWRLTRRPGFFDDHVVIYDRFYSSISGFKKSIQQQKHFLEQTKSLPFLNPVNLSEALTDKKHFAQTMKKLNIRTPETTTLTTYSADELWNFVMNHNSLILKPRLGRMGKCVFRLNSFRKSVTISVTISINNKILIADNKWNLWGIIRFFCRQHGIKPELLIVQKTIDTCLIDNRTFDFRILVQRSSGDKKPGITGEVARVSRPAFVVPNIDQGGVVIPLDHCLSLIYKSFDDAQKMCQKLHQYALFAYNRLETIYGRIGEIGIDLLVDKKNKIWVVEMNSKPGRIAFERLASGFGLSYSQKRDFAEQRKISILNPVKYCQWLAKHNKPICD